MRPLEEESAPGDAADDDVLARRVRVAGVSFDPLTEAEVVEHIIRASRLGLGGYVVTPNVDICRAAARDCAHKELIARASLVVPDGMPLLWASRMLGDSLPERVTGASLIFSLTGAAARQGRSVYFLGGEPGVPDRAAERLRQQCPELIVAGADAPPLGFDSHPGGVDIVRRRVVAAAPDIVYVGMGFPRQERLIAQLRPFLPRTWFIACGAAIPFAAGAVRRAPSWMQQAGLEWLFRLITEPRRLARRYLAHDVPFAARLLISCAVEGSRRAMTGGRRPAVVPSVLPGSESGRGQRRP